MSYAYSQSVVGKVDAFGQTCLSFVVQPDIVGQVG